MDNSYDKLPPITKRIKDLINTKFDGNVRRFCAYLGLDASSKINRLFKIDKRNNEFPMPSVNILMSIADAFDVSMDWLVYGKDKIKTLNTINIESNTVDGSKNVNIGEHNSNTDTDGYLNIIHEQQKQISELLKLLQNGH